MATTFICETALAEMLRQEAAQSSLAHRANFSDAQPASKSLAQELEH
jgi:hypothetical protein